MSLMSYVINPIGLLLIVLILKICKSSDMWCCDMSFMIMSINFGVWICMYDDVNILCIIECDVLSYLISSCESMCDVCCGCCG